MFALKLQKVSRKSKKQVKAEVLTLLTNALKEFKTPRTEEKMRRKLKKASKSITPLVLKSKKEIANFSVKKSE